MAVSPVLRELNKIMVQRHPRLACEIGNLSSSRPGNSRLHWYFRRGEVEGGFPLDSGAKCIAFRKVGLLAEIRHKAQSPGITDVDYEEAEEVLRSLFIALDQHASGDWEVTAEDWEETAPGPSGAGVVCRLELKLAVKVLDDPWIYDRPTEDGGEGRLKLEGVPG